MRKTLEMYGCHSKESEDAGKFLSGPEHYLDRGIKESDSVVTNAIRVDDVVAECAIAVIVCFSGSCARPKRNEHRKPHPVC